MHKKAAITALAAVVNKGLNNGLHPGPWEVAAEPTRLAKPPVGGSRKGYCMCRHRRGKEMEATWEEEIETATD